MRDSSPREREPHTLSKSARRCSVKVVVLTVAMGSDAAANDRGRTAMNETGIETAPLVLHGGLLRTARPRADLAVAFLRELGGASAGVSHPAEPRSGSTPIDGANRERDRRARGLPPHRDGSVEGRAVGRRASCDAVPSTVRVPGRETRSRLPSRGSRPTAAPPGRPARLGQAHCCARLGFARQGQCVVVCLEWSRDSAAAPVRAISTTAASASIAT